MLADGPAGGGSAGRGGRLKLCLSEARQVRPPASFLITGTEGIETTHEDLPQSFRIGQPPAEVIRTPVQEGGSTVGIWNIIRMFCR